MSAGQFHWSKNPIGLYRDTRKAKVAGVCAGLAAYLDIRVKFIRIGLILGLVFFFVPVSIAYVVLALVLKPMPEQMFQSEAEERFWRGVTASPNRTAGDLRARFRSLDRRLSEIETRVTSDEFSLRQKFRDLNA
jgi:phage shock protein C